MTLLLVLVGGAAGAIVRYLISESARARVPGRFPWGTLVANVAGSFVAGLIAGVGWLPAWVGILAGPGFCGALTTYSTFALETATADRRYALINSAVTLTAGLTAAGLGMALAGRF